MIDLILPLHIDVSKTLPHMTFRRQAGMNGHHTNQQFKTHEKVEWEYVKYPPHSGGRYPFNVITEKTYD